MEPRFHSSHGVTDRGSITFSSHGVSSPYPFSLLYRNEDFKILSTVSPFNLNSTGLLTDLPSIIFKKVLLSLIITSLAVIYFLSFIQILLYVTHVPPHSPFAPPPSSNPTTEDWVKKMWEFFSFGIVWFCLFVFLSNQLHFHS